MADYASLLRGHVASSCRCVDRFFLQGYVPKLQSVVDVCNFLRSQPKVPVPSSAACGKIGEAYVREIERFARDNAVPFQHFKKGESKEAVARPLIDAAAKEGGEGKVVLVGVSQEKASAWRSWPAKGQEKARHPHMERARRGGPRRLEGSERPRYGPDLGDEPTGSARAAWPSRGGARWPTGLRLRYRSPKPELNSSASRGPGTRNTPSRPGRTTRPDR